MWVAIRRRLFDLNVIEAMNKAQALLHKAGIELAQLESGILMSYLIGCPRVNLYLDRERILDKDKVKRYFEMVDRRAKGVPIHYIIGFREFMGLNFCVNEKVLIPRPDTEILVEYVIGHFSDMKGNICRILDIGTGSGITAVALAKYIKDSLITAVDIDDSVLQAAKKNAKAHGVEDRIIFTQGDLFAPLKDLDDDIRFDIMVSNPPYIPTADIEDLEPQIRNHEPIKALDGGRDGLEFYRRLSKGARGFLKEGGLWVVEVGYNQANQVADILVDNGYYHDIHFIKDLGGFNRIVAATYSIP